MPAYFFTAICTAWFSPLSFSWVIWGGLCLLGFPPELVAFQAACSNIYQFFTHTKLIDKCWSPVEYVFVTPSHHRVHHARNAIYIDKNYGGILIIWDRLFGTFQKELKEEPCQFGVNSAVELNSMLNVNFGAFKNLLVSLKQAKSLSDIIDTLFMPPDWKMPHLRSSNDIKGSSEVRP